MNTIDLSSDSPAIANVPTDIGADPDTNPFIPYAAPTTGTVILTLLDELQANGRSGLFVNPVANTIAATYGVANTLLDLVSSTNNNLTTQQRANLVSLINTEGAKVIFSAAPTTGQIIEIITPAYGNDINPRTPESFALKRQNEFFVAAGGAQTTFNISSSYATTDKYRDSSIREHPTVYIDSAYQRPNIGSSGGTYTYVPPKPRANSLIGTIQRLKDHTDRLSGLVASNSEDTIDLEEVMNLGIALNTLNEGKGNNNVLYCMSALFSNNILNNISGNISFNIITELKSNTVNAEFATRIISDSMNTLNQIVDADLNYYSNVQSAIRNSTLSAFIESSASEPSGKYLFRDVIGTDTLKQILKL
jgi:hypothetical protein